METWDCRPGQKKVRKRRTWVSQPSPCPPSPAFFSHLLEGQCCPWLAFTAPGPTQVLPISFTLLTHLSSSWALVFLIFPVHAHVLYLYSSSVICASCTLFIFAFMLTQELLAGPNWPFTITASFLAIEDGLILCILEDRPALKDFWKISQGRELFIPCENLSSSSPGLVCILLS